MIILDTHCHIFERNNFVESSLNKKPDTLKDADFPDNIHTNDDKDLLKMDLEGEKESRHDDFRYMHCVMSVDTNDWEKLMGLKDLYVDMDFGEVSKRNFISELSERKQDSLSSRGNFSSPKSDTTLDNTSNEQLNSIQSRDTKKNVNNQNQINLLGFSQIATIGIGIHPWKAPEYAIQREKVFEEGVVQRISSESDNEGSDSLLNTIDHEKKDLHSWLLTMEEMLQSDENIIVGEIGLDKHAKCPYTNKVDMEIQQVVFEKQLEIAIKYRRPISIHCVKSYGLLFDILQKAKARFHYLPSTSLHSYTGSTELALQLITLYQGPKKKTQMTSHIESKAKDHIGYEDETKVYFGFSKSVNLKTESILNKTKSLISSIPMDRILLESDVFAGEQARSDLLCLSRLLADWKGIELNDLTQSTAMNAFRWMKKIT